VKTSFNLLYPPDVLMCGTLPTWLCGLTVAALAAINQATEDQSSGLDLFQQRYILNEWFERGGYPST
jgi:hypothetical protein